MSENFPMRAPCRCGGTLGRIDARGGQDCVFCSRCGKHQYNAPKTETGRKPRTVQTVHNGVSANQRARILMRANGACELCRSQPTPEHPLHVGHLLSVKDGVRLGLTDTQINDDENLAAFCDACNLGMGQQAVQLHLAAAIVMARTRNRNGGGDVGSSV